MYKFAVILFVRFLCCVGLLTTLPRCNSATAVVPTLQGLPVDENQLQQVFDLANSEGPDVIGQLASSPLAHLHTLTFDANVLACDVSGSECLGMTYTTSVAPTSEWSGAEIYVAMLEDSPGITPTNDVRCTALLHELMHLELYNLTGDPDFKHTTERVWGDEGFVQAGVTELCPSRVWKPENLN